MIDIRPVRSEDAAELAALLNAIIARGGTTALQVPYTPEALDNAYLTGPRVICCFVAVDSATGHVLGFQTLGRLDALPADIGDIGTFTRVDGIQRGVGSALFAATRARARALGLSALNAVIRADNVGGLTFYTRQGFIDHAIVTDVPLSDGTRVDRVWKRFPL